MASGISRHQTVYCLVRLPGSKSPVRLYTCEGGRGGRQYNHADRIMIRDLTNEKKKQEGFPAELTVYINYTPCYACAKALVEDFLTPENLTMTVIAASPYCVTRVTCLARDCTCIFEEQTKRSDENNMTRGGRTKGERSLTSVLKANHPLKIQAFADEDWEALSTLLNDRGIKKGSDPVPYKQLRDGTGVKSRKIEDIYVQVDLEFWKEDKGQKLIEKLFSKQTSTQKIDRFKELLTKELNLLGEWSCI